MIITIGTKIKDGNQNTYVLDQVLGQGGFGCVYKAHRETDGQVFAKNKYCITCADESRSHIAGISPVMINAEPSSSKNVVV